MSNAEQRADWAQQADNERRRFLEEHPGYEQCPKHPERPVVNSGVCTLRFCAECVEDHKARWADREPRGFDDGISAWIHGAGDRPSSYFTKEPK